MGAHLQRAQILLEQSRHDLAADELRQELAADPDNALAHALLAICLAKREAFADATVEAEAAVRLAPAIPFSHYALAHVLQDRNHLPEAETAALEAIRLDPEDPDFHALLASIRFEQRRWPTALEAAEVGLRLNAEHIGCNNLRAMALVKLGRQTEAGETLATTLAKDPEDAVTHANLGWALLEEGKTIEAMEHFREALRLDPELDWARIGIVEALKARHFIYRWMLRYFLWMQKLSRRAQWMVVLGGFFGYQILDQQAEAHPAIKPWVLPIQVAYIAFVLLTWTADPLFNLLLRMNRFGRLALSREQVVASNWIGGFLAVALTFLGLWLVSDSFLALLSALIFGMMIIPLAALFNCSVGWPRKWMTIYTVVMGTAGFSTLALFMLQMWQFATYPFVVFLGMALLDTWVANILQGFRPRR
jgi:tetratricopeptide (TPR) repeat protein